MDYEQCVKEIKMNGEKALGEWAFYLANKALGKRSIACFHLLEYRKYTERRRVLIDRVQEYHGVRSYTS